MDNKPAGPAGTGTRYDIPYRTDHCYITRTEQSLSISMVAQKDTGEVDEDTLTGIGIISSVITLCIEHGISSEEISAAISENSRRKNDLADYLSKIMDAE